MLSILHALWLHSFTSFTFFVKLFLSIMYHMSFTFTVCHIFFYWMACLLHLSATYPPLLTLPYLIFFILAIGFSNYACSYKPLHVYDYGINCSLLLTWIVDALTHNKWENSLVLWVTINCTYYSLLDFFLYGHISTQFSWLTSVAYKQPKANCDIHQ